MNTERQCVKRRTLYATFVVAVVWSAQVCAATVSVSGVGIAPLPSGATGAQELSGITWAGGSQYYVVSDANATVYPLTVHLDMITGAVTSAALDNGIALVAGSDLEGIAYEASTGHVYVSDETGPAIRRHSLVDGSLTGTVTVPAVYDDYRANRSFESLSMRSGGASLWTCNEEALANDGPVSTVGAGTTVRLQKFDSTFTPAGQWAYVTDGITGDIPFTTAERSGVSDVCVLPGGTVLVLERELGWMNSPFGPQFRNRIYEIDLTGATDVSGIAAIDNATFDAVGKSLLWEGLFGSSSNFEGIALGPALAGGKWSLLLVSDDGSGLSQNLYALTLAGEVATPGDADLDGLVDGADLALWQQNYDPLGTGGDNNTWAMGNWNDDNMIDGADLALWQQNYSPLVPPTGVDDVPLGCDVGEVPEPVTTGLLLLGSVVLMMLGRRRRAPGRSRA